MRVDIAAIVEDNGQNERIFVGNLNDKPFKLHINTRTNVCGFPGSQLTIEEQQAVFNLFFNHDYQLRY